jgi:hypothetical protein
MTDLVEWLVCPCPLRYEVSFYLLKSEEWKEGEFACLSEGETERPQIEAQAQYKPMA